MSVYKPHTLVTFGGTLNTAQAPKEIWQCGVRILNADMTGPLARHDTYLNEVATPLAAWFALPGNASFPLACNLDWIKANPIGANGKYSEGSTYIHDYAAPVPGALSTASGYYPDILAIAISWGTVKAIRKGAYASHGRIYLPAYGQWTDVPGSMRLEAGWNGLFAAKGTALLHILAGTTQPAVPIVASGHAGEFEPITSVRVGDVYDVQRRRKDALKEVYSSLPYEG